MIIEDDDGIPQFAHQPVRPPRDLLQEQVYSRKWFELMERGPTDDSGPGTNVALASIMADHRYRLTPRMGQVCASIVTWLGTNCGLAYMIEARRMTTLVNHGPRGWLAAWAIENRRMYGVNDGVITIEACLSEGLAKPVIGLATWIVPDLSSADLESADHLVYWLGGREGQDFIADCEREILIQQRRLSKRDLAILGVNMSIPPQAPTTSLEPS